VAAVALLSGHAFTRPETWDGERAPVPPKAVGMSAAHLRYISEAVAASIERKEIPGAVVTVGRRGRVIFNGAFGRRAVQPLPEPMTRDTVFDMASLTKVMATAPSIMILVEQGKLRLDDKVKRYLPKFVGGGKDAVTVRQLMTHYSGLRADFDLSKRWWGSAAALDELWTETVQGDPGKDFTYSDLNFIALGEIIRAITGEGLDVYSRHAIFEPLGMKDTGFNPPATWRPRIAPTETRSRSLQYLKGAPVFTPEILRGEVHDPTAWRMEGVAGHAGLFSSARDTAIFAQMLLNGGIYRGKRILSQLAVSAMTSPQPPRTGALRGLGWDVETTFSSPRGDLLPGGFGHTGFTGTSLWVCPAADLFVSILTNRVHPDGRGDATHLRAVIANVVAASITDWTAAPEPH
jgi:CubicO group peptidase (beta-lactamase class C family)